MKKIKYDINDILEIITASSMNLPVPFFKEVFYKRFNKHEQLQLARALFDENIGGKGKPMLNSKDYLYSKILPEELEALALLNDKPKTNTSKGNITIINFDADLNDALENDGIN